jgi:hypothetical protein
MPILHMQTDSARVVEQQIVQGAQLIESEWQQINSSVQTLMLSWQGSSATQFLQEVQALLGSLRNCQTMKQDLANRLGREVAQWEQVASVLGGGVAGAIGSAQAPSAPISRVATAVAGGTENSSEASQSTGGVPRNNQKGGGSVSAASKEPSVPEASTEPAENPPEVVDQAQPAAPPSGPGVGAGLKPWIPVDPTITNANGERSANAYDAVLNQFNVGENNRYAQNQQGKGETYCNIFVWDATKAMGVEIPHWVDGNGNGVGVAQGGELSANGQIAWLRTHGESRGWRAVSGAEAQSMANSGNPAIAAWNNPSGIGHVGMIRPGENMALAQAGGSNFNDGTVAGGFGNRGPIAYYIHD